MTRSIPGVSSWRGKVGRLAGVGCVALLLAGVPARAWAQEPLRAALAGDPRVGQEAPDFQIPYLTALGPGPADQPFHLRAELGRRVVLVFGASTGDPAAVAVWDRLAAGRDSLGDGGLVVAGLFREGAGTLGPWAAARGGAFKYLADSTGRVFRRYGARPVSGAVQVFVVGDDGRVLYRNRRVAPDDDRVWMEISRQTRGR